MSPRRVNREVIRVIGPSIAYVPLTQNQYSLIDSEDSHRVNKFTWHAHWMPGNRVFYAARSRRKAEGNVPEERLHNFIFGRKSGYYVDHIKGKTLDNRQSQLRHATVFENSVNRKLDHTNTTGCTGVSFAPRTINPGRSWRVRVTFLGRCIYLGGFHTFEEAAQMYTRAARIYHGEESRSCQHYQESRLGLK